jgi:hypothetical protein
MQYNREHFYSLAQNQYVFISKLGLKQAVKNIGFSFFVAKCW